MAGSGMDRPRESPAIASGFGLNGIWHWRNREVIFLAIPHHVLSFYGNLNRMSKDEKPPRERVVQWVFLAGFASVWIAGMTVYKGEAIRGSYISPWLIGAVLMAVVATGLWFEQKWARWLGIVVLLVMALNTLGGLVIRFEWLPAAAVGVLGWLVWDLWRLPVGQSRSDEDDEPFLSLVLLFREPVYLEPAILAQMASDAWDAEVEVGTEDDIEEEEDEGEPDDGMGSFLVGESPHFFCSHWPAFFAIHNFDEPYFDDAEEVAQSLSEMRVRQAVEQHRAWVSVDLLNWFGEEEGSEEQAYRLIARLLAELADDNCLAVIDPAEGRVFAYDPETEAKLRSENPLEGLRDWYFAPILTVDGDDPEMAAAVDEARRRWPEFVAAFEQRNDDDQPYLVKAPFTDGDSTEFMWVSVTGIENDVIYGKLGNSPANVRTVGEGDVVRVKLEDLNDWLCVIDDAPTGGFTLQVLSERNRDEP